MYSSVVAGVNNLGVHAYMVIVCFFSTTENWCMIVQLFNILLLRFIYVHSEITYFKHMPATQSSLNENEEREKSDIEI